MFQQPITSNVIRFGILTLPLSGLLTLVGLIGRYTIPNLREDRKAALEAAGSTEYFVSQLVGNVLGMMMLIFGLLALTAYLANTRVRGLALGAMVVSIIAIALILSALGVTTYALPELSRAYLSGQQDTLRIFEGIFGGLVGELFVPVFIFYSAGYILFGVCIWRSGVLPKPAAISLGLHPPLFATFIRPEPTWTSIVGALLFIAGATMIALKVFREPSAGEAQAKAEHLQGNTKKAGAN
ncbi:MAG: hypothetical protein JO266_13410 [Acidobacteria bacterium]|nr:hypothetical protein [Acidobacteriota bacterium]